MLGWTVDLPGLLFLQCRRHLLLALLRPDTKQRPLKKAFWPAAADVIGFLSNLRFLSLLR